jgi:hypothetical protein
MLYILGLPLTVSSPPFQRLGLQAIDRLRDLPVRENRAHEYGLKVLSLPEISIVAVSQSTIKTEQSLADIF